MSFEQKIAALQSQNEQLQNEVDRLRGMLVLLKRDKFGSKSERFVEIPPEQLIFNEIEQEAATLSLGDEAQTVTYDRKKGRAPKKPYPEDLPREEKIIDLPESEKVCPHDGARLKEIGEERTEKLKVIPAQMSLVIEIKKKYACLACEGHMVQAKSNSILPGTIATPELLSFIVFSKFFQALPLYRLEELFKLKDVRLTRGTMGRWMMLVSEKLIPLYNILQDKMFESGYMCIDATTLQVLKEPGRKAQTKSFMWARGSPELGIVLFDYDQSGGGKVAKRLVTGFSGTLQADAHRGYDILEKQDLLQLGCMMHSRRRFNDAFIEGKKRPGVAADALAMFKWLYDKEESYKQKGFTPRERKEWRDKEIAPSLEAIKQWAESKVGSTLKQSTLGNALHYFINEYDELTAFLKDGRYEMDNGWLERMIKKFAIGRNNWLFCDTVGGAHASSILYSLTLTAKLNNKNPFETMTEIFRELPKATTLEDYERIANLLLGPANPNSCRKKEGALIR